MLKNNMMDNFVASTYIKTLTETPMGDTYTTIVKVHRLNNGAMILEKPGRSGGGALSIITEKEFNALGDIEPKE